MISDLTFCELREKEVVNLTDGKKLFQEHLRR